MLYNYSDLYIIKFLPNVLTPCLVLAAIMVVTVSNPIYSILFLILLFFLSSWLFIIMYLHFLAMIVLMVYLGAVCVLFLFVVMMLNIKMLELKRNINFIPFFFVLLSFMLLVTLNYSDLILDFCTSAGNFFFVEKYSLNEILFFFIIKNGSSIKMVGSILYTFFSLQFIISSLILFIAMVGAIFLTLESANDYRKEDFVAQITRIPNFLKI